MAKDELRKNLGGPRAEGEGPVELYEPVERG